MGLRIELDFWGLRIELDFWGLRIELDFWGLRIELDGKRDKVGVTQKPRTNL